MAKTKRKINPSVKKDLRLPEANNRTNKNKKDLSINKDIVSTVKKRGRPPKVKPVEEVKVAKKAKAVATGQAAVFYTKAGIMIGGGIISEVYLNNKRLDK